MCPHCGQAAPLVYRGVLAYCTACGQLRGPLTGSSVNHAGQVSKAGGAVAQTFGWLSLAAGIVLALFFGAVLGWWPVAGILGALSLTAFAFWMWAGRALARRGRRSEVETKESAVHSLAASRRGELRGADLVQSLGLGKADADALLEAMSKAHPDDISLEIDEQGGLYYLFRRFRQRLGTERPSPDAAGERIASSERVTSDDPLLDKFAALEAEEAAAARKVR